jgi:predicted metalloprotease
VVASRAGYVISGMRWRRRRRSGDLIDRRGGGRGLAIGGALGLPAIVVVLLVTLLGGGGSIGDALDDLTGAGGGTQTRDPNAPDPDAELVDFVSFVLDDVQATWVGIFDGSGRRYERAELVLFEGATTSACGDFFRELHQRFGAPGDFAQAYVIAHEIGHHVQRLLGIEADVRREQEADPDRANDLSVRMELQADCLAGVWGFTARQRGLLEPGDLREGLDAAAAIGDDRLQRQGGQRVDRESWTHGSSAQRVEWFQRGFDSGDPENCDTFSGDV